tara:strand:+ start:391 stop:963 length:573 start_codon:yes stop_codon:yes gene_type:complete
MVGQTPNKLSSFWKSIKHPQPVIGFYSHNNGDYRSFSNFYTHRPFNFNIPCGSFSDRIEKITFSEKAIMLCKASLMGDEVTYRSIRNCDNPKDTKELGRQVKPFIQELWNKNICNIAKAVVLAKFKSIPELRALLLNTGDSYIAEAAPRDKIWGIGMGVMNPKINIPAEWNGVNILGWALMEVRNELRNP